MPSTSSRDDGLDASLTQDLTVGIGIVASIREDSFGFLNGTTARSADRRYRINQWQQLRNIIAVRTAQDGDNGKCSF